MTNLTPERSERHPRLCVGLPVYNGAVFLEETLDSILDQSFEDFELIVSDNASTDATPRIIQAYASRDERIRYTRREKNVGASANFDGVWKECRSEYFKWVAADDPLGPRFFERCIEALDENRSAGLAYPRAAFIDEDSHVLYRFEDLVQVPRWSAHNVHRVRQAIDVLLRDGSTANVLVFGVMRSSMLRDVTPIGNYFGADLPLVAEIVTAAEVIELRETLSFFRRHRGSSSSYTRSPSAAGQQEFYDPSVKGRLRLQWNLRRRYWELARVAGSAPVGAPQRLVLVAAVAAAMARRLLWRAKFELDLARGMTPPSPSWPGEPPHWTEISA